jgi:hypothetical protein
VGSAINHFARDVDTRVEFRHLVLITEIGTIVRRWNPVINQSLRILKDY